jgi:hypothetical protein
VQRRRYEVEVALPAGRGAPLLGVVGKGETAAGEECSERAGGTSSATSPWRPD